MMKRVAVIIHQREINKFSPQAFQLILKDEVSIIDTIKAVDEEIRRKLAFFPWRIRKLTSNGISSNRE
ncbi:MAG: hypothetical protein QXG58_07665 [Candidatus Bathyarchaeia archaeon]